MKSDVRADNERRSARLLARSELLDISDLDWHRVGDRPVEPGVIDCLVYMRDVEAFTNRYLSGLVAHPATLGDPLVAAFLPIWQSEEGAHADALDRYLAVYATRTGLSIPAMQSPPPVRSLERWLVVLTRPVGHVVTAAHMTWGAANELLTMTGYRLLAARCSEPILAELLRRVAAQESRHYGFYRMQAEWRLAASCLARRLLPSIMRRSWTPVGIGDGFKHQHEFDRVLAFLSATAQGRAAAVTMDGAFRRLPGCGELAIFQTAVRESQARLRSIGTSESSDSATGGGDHVSARERTPAPMARQLRTSRSFPCAPVLSGTGVADQLSASTCRRPRIGAGRTMVWKSRRSRPGSGPPT